MANFGDVEGETCWRNGCQGVIQNIEVEGCSCHINPPCSACTTPREFCPVCDWSALEEDKSYGINDYIVKENPANPVGAYEWWKPRPLDPRKIDYRSKGHTNSGMIKEGVYPQSGNDSADRAAVEKVVKGTFGGRFKHFGGGKFEYIAYTD